MTKGLTVVALLVMLSACGGGGGSAPTPPTTLGGSVPAAPTTQSGSAAATATTLGAAASTSASDVTEARARGADPNVIYYLADGVVSVYAKSASGNASPLRTFTVPEGARFIATDYSNNVYLASSNTIWKYAPITTSNPQPIATYALPNASQYTIEGIALRYDGGIAMLLEGASTNGSSAFYFGIYNNNDGGFSIVEQIPDAVGEAGVDVTDPITVDGSGAVLAEYSTGIAYPYNIVEIRKWSPQSWGFEDVGPVGSHNAPCCNPGFASYGISASGSDQLVTGGFQPNGSGTQANLYASDNAPLPAPVVLSGVPFGSIASAFGPKGRLFVYSAVPQPGFRAYGPGMILIYPAKITSRTEPRVITLPSEESANLPFGYTSINFGSIAVSQ